MTENKRFTINDCRVLSNEQVFKILNQLTEENEQLEEENNELKIKNDLLSDELEQAKAVINKKWSEYLKKKME